MTEEKGVAAAPGAAERGALVHPVDAPRVVASTVWGLLQGLVARDGADADAVVAGFGGRRGHPVWVAPRRMAELREAPPEHPRGLRGWMQDRSWKVETLETGDPSVLEDFDRREDVEGKGNHR